MPPQPGEASTAKRIKIGCAGDAKERSRVSLWIEGGWMGTTSGSLSSRRCLRGSSSSSRSSSAMSAMTCSRTRWWLRKELPRRANGAFSKRGHQVGECSELNILNLFSRIQHGLRISSPQSPSLLYHHLILLLHGIGLDTIHDGEHDPLPAVPSADLACSHNGASDNVVDLVRLSYF